MAGAEAEPMDRRPDAQLTRSGGVSFQRTPETRELRHHLRHGDLRAVAGIRGLLRERLHDWGVAALVDTAELLASEVVTNALVHTTRGAVLTVTLSGGAEPRVRVEVFDFASHCPKARAANDHASGGRGLLIVESLSDAWGVRTQPVGKTVWFELAVPAR